jgi:aspartate-semialdehyde dehydrogenase
LAKPVSDIFQVALVGGETLLGHELKEVFEAQLTGTLVTGYSASGEGTFGESEGEAVYVDTLDSKAVESVDVVVTAGAAEGSRKAYSLAKALKQRVPIVDCAGHLEQEAEARVLAPVPGETNPAGVSLFVTAQPAAAAIAETLQRLSRWSPIARSVVNIFEPASERGKPGAAELHQQTTSLLAFRGLDKDIYDAQLGFNLLPQYGSAAPLKLGAVERRIEHHIGLLLGEQPAKITPTRRPPGKQPVNPFGAVPDRVPVPGELAKTGPPMPSVRLIQAPVFHAYSISLWVEFTAEVSVSDLRHALASAQIEVREGNQEPPTGVGATGHSGLIAGDIRADRNNPRAAWIWEVCDNLRMTADIAVTLIRSLKAQKS